MASRKHSICALHQFDATHGSGAERQLHNLCYGRPSIEKNLCMVFLRVHYVVDYNYLDPCLFSNLAGVAGAGHILYFPSRTLHSVVKVERYCLHA